MEVNIRYNGPIFGPGVDDKVRTAIGKAVHDLVIEGERQVDLQLYPGHGLVTGHYRRSVHGEMSDSLHGRIHDSLVVYGPWLEGVSSRNQRSRFKGYHMFRNAFQQLEKIKVDVIKKWVSRLVGDLS